MQFNPLSTIKDKEQIMFEENGHYPTPPITHKRTLTRTVPLTRIKDYLSMGNWAEVMRGENYGVVSCTIKSNDLQPKQEKLAMKKPDHIQRAKINRPLGMFEDVRLSKAVRYDYMGNAHFEFGALNHSLRRLQAQFMLCHHVKAEQVKLILDDGRSFALRMFGNFDTQEQKDQYAGWVQEILNGKHSMEEDTFLEPHYLEKGKLPERADFWWDIENDVMFSFDKNFMKRLETNLKHSFVSLGEA